MKYKIYLLYFASSERAESQGLRFNERMKIYACRPSVMGEKMDKNPNFKCYSVYFLNIVC